MKTPGLEETHGRRLWRAYCILTYMMRQAAFCDSGLHHAHHHYFCYAQYLAEPRVIGNIYETCQRENLIIQ